MKKRKARGKGSDGVEVRTVVTRLEEMVGRRMSSKGSAGEVVKRMFRTASESEISVFRLPENACGFGTEFNFGRKDWILVTVTAAAPLLMEPRSVPPR